MSSNPSRKLAPSLSRPQFLAFAVGSAVGWGSLVVTANTYLSDAGPLGSVLGLVIGGLIMILISRSYAYLMQVYPDAGGAYTYARESFSHDHGFLNGWFLSLVYLAILWANATSIPLFFRNFVGPFFEFGKMYTLFGYDVYLGETLLTMAVILMTALLCIRSKKGPVMLMTVLVGVFVLGILAAFLGSFLSLKGSLSPAFTPDTSALKQIVDIAIISPWAFVGFESVSHSAEELKFKKTCLFRCLVVAIAIITLLYGLVTLLSVTAYPAQYGSWLEYIRDLKNQQGLAAFPAFYAANHYLGSFGVFLLMASLLALVLSSLIGLTIALSRLFYALGKDKVLPPRFGELNGRGIPARAIALIAAVSLAVPFVGRVAIGWIVDVTTIGAILIYGFVSAAAAKAARLRQERSQRITALISLGIMLAFGLYILIPNLFFRGTLERETYFLFVVWTLLGFIYFRSIIHRDQERRFGTSTVVWVALLSLVLLISVIWMRQSMIAANDRMVHNVQVYYENSEIPEHQRIMDERYVEEQLAHLERENVGTILITLGMFGFALIIMLTNQSYMNHRSRESEALANVDPMTGVKSKHAYLIREKELDAAIAGEGGAEPPEFAVAVCDVNGLKYINDTLGHKAGDEYITKASALICEIFSHSPVYRTGGDEFVVILTGRDYENRSLLMKLLHDRSVANISAGGVVVSGGLSEFDRREDLSFHTVFQRADELMYEEKQLLKGLGSVSRDQNPALEQPPMDPASVMNLRKSILIADDVAINRMMLAEGLREDYDILEAEDGVEALDLIGKQRGNIALVLLDLRMPRMDGLEVLRSLSADPDLRKIPVIVLTADQKAEVECLRFGAMDFLSKPYPEWEIVRARINKCIELSETRALIQSTERDSLTTLYNMDYFLRYVQIYDRHYPDMTMDAVYVDVNHFHMINERSGKEYGDGVLRRLGWNLRHAAREIGGIACHRGADAFLLYCPHRDSYESLLNQLSEGLSGEEDSAAPVRLRLGIYPCVDKSLETERRFDRAKMAADAVRGSHVQTIGQYDDALHQRSLYRDRLLNDFRSSLENNRFKVYYQPKFDIRGDHPVLSSAEALVRWDHPELGMISPAMFIPLLEESGLILDLDTFVWREAAARIRAWKDRFGAAIPVSVNVSRIDMLAPDLKGIFRNILNTWNLTAEDLILEVTESAYTGDSAGIISMARELRESDLGFRIEMDDFGTGYSSLGMLTTLPIDVLKLDMTFVRSAFGETRDVRMIELIIDIADYLHVPVVAEGVETREQMMVLKALGCDLIQGYYFSKPVPPEDFDRFLIERGDSRPLPRERNVKSFPSITKSLTNDFTKIEYVDMLTGDYLEFSSGPEGELRILPDGAGFFDRLDTILLDGIVPQEEAAARNVLNRDHLFRYAQDGTPFTFSFAYRTSKGESGLRMLQTLRTRNADGHHLVLGVR